MTGTTEQCLGLGLKGGMIRWLPTTHIMKSAAPTPGVVQIIVQAHTAVPAFTPLCDLWTDMTGLDDGPFWLAGLLAC